MGPRIPSESSGISIRRNDEVRRRSGGPSSKSESEVQSGYLTSALKRSRFLKPFPDLPEDDPHRPRSSDDYNKSQISETTGLKATVTRDTDAWAIRSEERAMFERPTPRLELPLPSLPTDPCIKNNPEIDLGQSFASIPLTPRPDGPFRFESHSSQRTGISLFPRLPTPDFSAFKLKHLPQSIISPFGVHALTPPTESRLPSRSLSVLTLPTDHTIAVKGADHLSVSSIHSQSFTKSTPTQSIQGRSDCESSETLCGEDQYPHFMTTVPSRFTHKFPPPASVGLRISLHPDAFEMLIASEKGDDSGVEEIGRWTEYKWCLLLSVLTVFGYAMTGLVCSILTWFGTHSLADVMWVADNDILVFITLASTLLLMTSLVGLTGTLLNSRAILAFYALLLWPSFISMLVVGYASYKREAFALDRKLNMAWSQRYDDLGRLIIQESLHCCGFYNPLHEATFSKNCYPRTPLPGCKGKLFQFEQDNLRMCWRLAFSLVPLHVLNIIASLLCSNHVDRRFGKGLTPRAYRLSMIDVRANADAILAKLSDTKLPLEPSRALSHLTDREDRPAMPRSEWDDVSKHDPTAIGQIFLRG
ncbi:hypothetical protein K439DRAFT_1664947 [Ramaria rubella]|nr:hypothetical protein K439DRAFT_1664947 [Ramaria rubella]